MNRETRCILTSIVAGAIIGWVIGMAQLIYIGSWPLFYWAFMPLIPIYSALGGALYGMIMAGGGLFAEPKRSATESSAAEPAHSHAA
jgi:hypothetical protein